MEGNEVTSKDLFTNNKLFAKINNKGKWGFEDKSGNMVVDAKYDEVTEFNENGFAGIKLGEKWGIIDENGNVVIEPVYKIEQANMEPNFIGKYYEINYNGSSYFTDTVN